MGAHLVQILSEKGVETVVTSRGNRVSEENVRYIEGNAKDLDFLIPILQERWDAIVDFMVYSTAAFAARVEALLDATSHYMFLSSSRVYAESSKPLSEDSPRLLDTSRDKSFLATDEYSLSKARQEDILRRSGKSNWTIIRPYITYSEDRLQLGVLEKEEWLYRALKGRTIVFSRDIASKLTTLTYGLDVAKAMAGVIEKGGASGSIFHITSDQAIAWNDVLTLYLDVLEEKFGKRPKVLNESLRKFMECKGSKYQIIYDRLFNREFDNTRIRSSIDAGSFMDPCIGLESCLRNFLINPDFRHIDWIYEAIRDRQAGESASLKEMASGIDRLYYISFRYIRLPAFFRKPVLWVGSWVGRLFVGNSRRVRRREGKKFSD